MRVYGRVTNLDGSQTWEEVDTDAQGYNDSVNLTWLIQVLKLNLNESPFFADWGIPARPSVVQQVFPNFYVTRTQQRFAPFFAALSVQKTNNPTPEYDISVVTQQGAQVQGTIAT